MNTKTQQRIIEIANWVARKSPLMKKIIKPLYYPIKRNLQNRRNQQYRNNGLKALKDFTACLEANGYNYTLAFGTMLGAVREKGFIKHDLDIDIYLWADEWNKLMEKYLNREGFVLDHKFLIDEGALGREETYIRDGVSIDIFYIYPPVNKLPYCCDFACRGDAPSYRLSNKRYGGTLPRRIELPYCKDRILTRFEDTKFYIQANSMDLLKCRYGESFMTPDPTWHNGDNEHIIPWIEKLGVYHR